jgi:excisionase family DNA binding protein
LRIGQHRKGIAVMEDSLTSTEVAAMIGVTRRTVVRRIKAGVFPNARMVRRKGRAEWHVPRADVQAFLAKKDAPPAPPPSGLVIILPDEVPISERATHLRGSTYRVDLDTLRTLQRWLDQDPAQQDEVPPFAQRLDIIFRIVTAPDGKPYRGFGSKRTKIHDISSS